MNTNTDTLTLDATNIVPTFDTLSKRLNLKVNPDGSLSLNDTEKLSGEDCKVLFNHFESASERGKNSTLYSGYLAHKAGVWNDFQKLIETGRAKQTVSSLKQSCCTIIPALVENGLPLSKADFLRNVSSVLLLKNDKTKETKLRKGKEVASLVNAIREDKSQAEITSQAAKAKEQLVKAGKIVPREGNKRKTDSVITAPKEQVRSIKHWIRLSIDAAIEEGITAELYAKQLREVVDFHKFTKGKVTITG